MKKDDITKLTKKELEAALKAGELEVPEYPKGGRPKWVKEKKCPRKALET